VEGGPLVTELAARGLRSLYLIAGPDMLETMLRDRKLGRLFQTITHQLMGGHAFRTVSPGPEYGPLGHLKLRSLYYDPSSPCDTGQWFAQFDAINPQNRESEHESKPIRTSYTTYPRRCQLPCAGF
jgi:hypothetical protein